METSVPGASVKLDTGGRITITSPSGTDQEVTGLSLSTGGAAPLFDTQFASSTQTRAAAGIGTIQANDTLTLTAGTLTFDVAVTAGMTMQQVAQAINAANGGVSAAVTDGRLRVAGTGTGAAAQVSIASAGATAGQLGLVNTVDAADAQVEVDGVVYTSDTQRGDDHHPGRDADAEARVDRGHHRDHRSDVGRQGRRPSSRVKALVDQYNSVVDLIQTKIDGEARPRRHDGGRPAEGHAVRQHDAVDDPHVAAERVHQPDRGPLGRQQPRLGRSASRAARSAPATRPTRWPARSSSTQPSSRPCSREDREAARRLLDADGPSSAEDGIARASRPGQVVHADAAACCRRASTVRASR